MSVDCSAKYTDLCWFVNALTKEDEHPSTTSNGSQVHPTGTSFLGQTYLL